MLDYLGHTDEFIESLNIESTPVAANDITVEDRKPIINKDKKFIIGRTYYIYPFRNRRLKRTYICKKYIYSINESEVRVVVMKQIEGTQSAKRYTLNRSDCLMLHIKFEPGLEVFSMDLNWQIKKQ